MTRPIDFRLYVITDRARCAPRALQAVVRAACAAGVRAVQLREVHIGEADLARLARQLSVITREHGARLFVNARSLAVAPAVADEIDGLHFPDHAHALNRSWSELVVGRSVHSVAAAEAAARSGVDYMLFSPIYATPSKSRYGPPQGLDALAAVARAVDVPVFALGGVTPERAAACVEAGAHGVAVVGAIMGADDVAAQVRRFEEALGSL